MKREVYQVSVPVLSSMWLCLTPFDCTHLSPMSPQPSQWDSHPLRNKVGPFEMPLCSGTPRPPWSPFVHTAPCSTVPLSRLLGLDICSVCGSLRFSAPRGPEFAYVPLSSHIRLSLGADGCLVPVQVKPTTLCPDAMGHLPFSKESLGAEGWTSGMAWQNKPSLVIGLMGVQPNLPPSSQIWGLPKSALPLPRGSGAATLDSREQLCHSSSCHPFPSHILDPGNSVDSDHKPRRLLLEIKSRWFVCLFVFLFARLHGGAACSGLPLPGQVGSSCLYMWPRNM